MMRRKTRHAIRRRTDGRVSFDGLIILGIMSVSGWMSWQAIKLFWNWVSNLI